MIFVMGKTEGLQDLLLGDDVSPANYRISEHLAFRGNSALKERLLTAAEKNGALTQMVAANESVKDYLNVTDNQFLFLCYLGDIKEVLEAIRPGQDIAEALTEFKLSLLKTVEDNTKGIPVGRSFIHTRKFLQGEIPAAQAAETLSLVEDTSGALKVLKAAVDEEGPHHMCAQFAWWESSDLSSETLEAYRKLFRRRLISILNPATNTGK